MIDKKDIQILSHLRKNSNQPITDIARSTGIPVTTIYDRMRGYDQKLIKKYTVLLDFAKLGHHTKAKIAIKINKKEKEKIEEFVLACKNLNSFYRINYGYDYFIEAIFRNANEAHAFVDELEEKFEIKEKQIFFVMDEIERERFLAR